MIRRLALLAAVLLVLVASVASAQTQVQVIQRQIASASAFTVQGIITTSVSGIATTSSDGLVLQNTTAATGAVTVQISPRQRLRGTAWDTAASETVDFFTENLPTSGASPSGTWKLGYSLNGGAITYPMTVTSAGDANLLGSLTIPSGKSFAIGSTGFITGGGGTGLFLLRNQAATAGVGWDVTTDNIMAIRNRALNADASLRAAIYSSSASSVLTVSSNTIAPTGMVHHVGAGLIKTITVPATCTPTCVIQLVPDAAYTYDATGNIVVPSGGGTAVINKVMTFVWDGSKWTPSY